jgi:LEA14-like dessication related protein
MSTESGSDPQFTPTIEGPFAPEPAGCLRTWHLAVVLLLIVLLIAGAVGLFAMVSVDGLVENLEVTVEDVDVRFLDSKKKPVNFSASAVLNPSRTARRIQRGWVKVTLHLEVINRNSIDLTADKVVYRVRINKAAAPKGTLPKKGKGPIVLRRGVTEELPVSVRVKTKRVLKGGSKQVLKGARFVIRVTGKATVSVMGVPFERSFKVKKVHKYGGLQRSPIPLPI